MQQDKQAKAVRRPPLVIDDPSRYFLPFIERGVIYPVYRTQGISHFMSRVLRKLRIFGDIPPLFNDWRHTLDRGGKVVVFDSALSADVLARLEKYPQQVILFFWNRLETVQKFCPSITSRLDRFTIYSHDQNDCRDYGFKFISAFYQARPDAGRPTQLTKDVIFVGGNKNRMRQILHAHEQLQGLALDFHVYDPQQAGRQLAAGLAVKGDFLPYTAYLDRLMASRAVLEILQPGQNALTLRAMEALFYQKKLLTNHQQIVDEKFYNPSNILVFDDPRSLDEQKIRSFLATPFVPVNQKILDYYRYEQWLSRFE